MPSELSASEFYIYTTPVKAKPQSYTIMTSSLGTLHLFNTRESGLVLSMNTPPTDHLHSPSSTLTQHAVAIL